MSDQTIRCFLGVGLTHAVSHQIEQRLNSLYQLSWANNVRWVAPRNWHLTLAFLGNQSLDRLAILRSQLETAEINDEFRTDVFRSRWISGFPDANSPIVALECYPSKGLIDLKAGVDRVLAAQGFLPESRRFRPHITLGRVARGQRIHFNPVPCDLEFPYDCLSLYQSIMTAQGAEYLALWSIPLCEQPARHH